MPEHDDALDRARAVKARYEGDLMRYPNVVGVGVGRRQRSGQTIDEICIVVMVRTKRSRDTLDPADLLPAELDGVPVDVQETGDIVAL